MINFNKTIEFESIEYNVHIKIGVDGDGMYTASVSSTPIEIMASWSEEDAALIGQMQGIDCENELIRMMTEEISDEIDREIIEILRKTM